MRIGTALPLLAALAVLGPAGAAAASIPAPRDVAYAGPLRIEVDARDIERRVFRVRESIPVARPGRLTLLYPKWLPGNHAPTGPVEALGGLLITAAGQRVSWKRDPLDMHAFHVEVPAGARQLELEFQFITPGPGEPGKRVATPALLSIQWEKALLYPAGHFARRLTVEPTLLLPAGWSYATALTTNRREGDRVFFAPTQLDQFVDSPLFAGPHFRQFVLDEGAAPVYLNVFADRASQLEARPEQIEAHRKLVREAVALFGSRQYRRYDFLLAASDTFTGIGLEHLQSSENGVDADYFTDWDGTAEVRDLLPHEFVHSWNGKYRRPADLWTPQFNVPMQNSLLWVYEGMTQFWGVVLAARSGLWSEAVTREALAFKAGVFALQRPGRAWRSLQDTTQQPIIAYQQPLSYTSWQRAVDYYDEGLLLWLSADARIRASSDGRRSLDDLARRFFGGKDGDPGPSTYTFEDLLAALQATEAADWRGILREQLDGVRGAIVDPETELAQTGWKLGWSAKPGAYFTSYEKAAKQTLLSFSLGLAVANDGGRVSGVVWDSPAFRAGVAPGMTIVAVDGIAYSTSLLKDTVAASAQRTAPIELLLRDGERFRTVRVEYRGGARYPVLERVEGRVDRLSALLKPRT